MTISKAHWDTEGDNVRLSMPFSKVDVERRIVSGFATLDNVDKQDDIVTAEASMKAFSKFRGNIREMHQPVSVGKMVNFKEDKYFDPETKKFYSGVYVSAYVSKGAQNTWEKVLDGTLSGFSIGGKMNKWDDGYDSKSDSKIRIIKDYDLVELSLVDNPANQFANIMSIEKNESGEIFVKGEGTDTILENVFYDKESGIVLLSENESEVSPVNGAQMENIGFVEKTDNEKSEMIKFLVDSAKGINTEINKEVSPMTEENTETVVEETVLEETVVEKSEEVAPEADATIEADVEKSEHMDDEKKSMEEEEDAEKMEDGDEEEMMDEEAKKKAYKDKSKKSDEPEVSKSEDLATAITEIKDGISSAFSDLSDVIKSLKDEVNSVNGEIAEMKKSLGLVSAKLEDAESEFNEFGKRMEAVEADTAFRKSGDLGEIVQDQPNKVEKSLWGGRFLKTADLLR
jgi:hypothetical protein